jgi:hypothetical protein
MKSSLQNHIPYRMVVSNDQPKVLWLDTSGVSFDAPFFDETILRCMSLTPGMASFKCVSSLETMIEAAWDVDAVPVTAFLFHVSRCGSTLLSQSLVLSSENIVLSEVPFFDALLRHDFQDPDLKRRALQAAVRLYGQKRSEISNYLFIKLDSWSVYYHELLRALWPSTPFLLLYRNPLEVLQSHQKMAGMQAVPGLLEPWLFDIPSQGVHEKDRETYLGEVLAYYVRQFEQMFLTDHNSWLVSYHDGIEKMIQTLFSAIGLPVDSDLLTKTAERSRFHSKDPGKVFSEALADRPIPEAFREAYAGFERLEVLKNLGR